MERSIICCKFNLFLLKGKEKVAIKYVISKKNDKFKPIWIGIKVFFVILRLQTCVEAEWEMTTGG